MKRKATFLFALLAYFISSAQLQYISQEAMNGYTLFLGEKLFLANNCGEKVHSWDFISPSYHVKLLPNGNIVYITSFTNMIIEKNWNDEIVNIVSPADPKISLEYEVIVTPENNYLCVGRYDYTQEEFIATGYNTDSIGNSSHVDIIVEIDRNSGETLWLWDIMDHVIQERSDTIPNFGSVVDQPELLNLDAISTLDWQSGEAFMINGFDYNPDLDQIVCSLRKMGEIVIIDHSTTTEEAASHVGGNSGKGGDILYRWGNPKNYHQGTLEDQQLFYQHNPNWIKHGEHAGGIVIYDNGTDRPGITYGYDYSTVPIIVPPILGDNSYVLAPNTAFEPAVPSNLFSGDDPDNGFVSRFMSGAKVLENGNSFVTIAQDSRVLEFQPDGTLAWDYHLATGEWVFRAEKYSEDYPAFDGKDLTPMGTIEMPSSPVPCNLVSNIKGKKLLVIRAWFDHASNRIQVASETSDHYQLKLYSSNGNLLWRAKDVGSHSFPLQNTAVGTYFLSIRNMTTNEVQTQTITKLH